MTSGRLFHVDLLAAIDAHRRDAAAAPALVWPAATSPGFAVHVNTGLRALIDALAANYPSVARVLGPATFASLARAFAIAHPAADARLFHYGEGFADDLARHPVPGIGPHLPELARLDRLWMLCHLAADASPFDAHAWASQDPQALASAPLRLAPATHWHAHGTLPIHDLWIAARSGTAPEAVPAQARRALLFTRPGDEVLAVAIDDAACDLLAACRSGLPVAEAVAAVLQRHPRTDLQATLATLIAQGAFAGDDDVPPAPSHGVSP